MYESFFQLKELPFQLGPDPKFFFESSGHKRALAYLFYGLTKREGFLVLTGDVGTGKTTLVSALLAELAKKDIVAGRVLSSKLSASDMLRMVAASFGLPHEGLNKATLLTNLERHLRDLRAEGKRALLVVDEVQNTPRSALEELRMLSNLQHEDRSLLQIFLFGQHEFRDTLKASGMEQFRQRIVAAYHLGPLKPDEARGYIEHRLTVAGWEGDPRFTDDACAAVYRFSGGVPRRINTLCDRVLLFACVDERHVVDEEVVTQVMEELRGESFLFDLSPQPEAEAVPQPTEPGENSDGGGEEGPLDALRKSKRDMRNAGPAVPPKEPAAPANPRPAQDSQVLQRPLEPASGILCVAGGRVNMLKMASVVEALRAEPNPYPVKLVYTGQTNSRGTAGAFYRELDIPAPDICLGVEPATQAVRTAETMRRFEPLLIHENPAALLVVGDANATIGCSMVAAEHAVPIIHVEAGLRSFDHGAPLEVNRVLTDQLADLLFTTELRARDHLLREGVDPSKIHFVGGMMIDILRRNLGRAVPPAETLASHVQPALLQATEKGYALLMLNSVNNTDDPQQLETLLRVLGDISEELPVVFPIHPRIRDRVEHAGLWVLLNSDYIHCLPPLGHLQLLGLLADARVVLTDCGEMEEATTALQVPCVTLRDSTERSATVDSGTNRLCGSDPMKIIDAVSDVLSGDVSAHGMPDLWDGKAATRIRQVLDASLDEGRFQALRVTVH